MVHVVGPPLIWLANERRRPNAYHALRRFSPPSRQPMVEEGDFRRKPAGGPFNRGVTSPGWGEIADLSYRSEVTSQWRDCDWKITPSILPHLQGDPTVEKPPRGLTDCRRGRVKVKPKRHSLRQSGREGGRDPPACSSCRPTETADCDLTRSGTEQTMSGRGTL